jgi:hypothetical protein
MDRLNQAAASHPSWGFGQPEFVNGPGGIQASMTVRFSDGSALTFYDSRFPGGNRGLRLDSTNIRR